MNEKNYSNAGIAGVLSFIFTGLGQIYNGSVLKGLVLMSVSAAAVLALLISAIIAANVILGSMGIWPSDFIKAVTIIAVSVIVIGLTGSYSIYDAYRTANKINK